MSINADKAVASISDLTQAKAAIKRLDDQLQETATRAPKQPFILRCGVAVLAVITALLINRLLHLNLVGAPAMLFLCALMFSALYAGVKPALIAVPVAVAAFTYYFVTPVNSWAIDVREIPRLFLFLTASLFVIWLSGSQKRATESLRLARDVLADTVQELTRTNQALRTENRERQRVEEEFRAIVENAPDHIARYDSQFQRTYANPSLAKSYGLPIEELIHKPMFSIIRDAGVKIDEQEFAQIQERFSDVFRTGKSCEFDITLPMPSGRRDYSVRLFPELDVDGSVINVLSIAREITVSKHAEEELRKEKEVLKKIFDNIPVLIGFVGKDGRVKLVNREWERVMGWTLKELQAENVDIFSEAYPDLPYRQKVFDFIAAATGDWVDLKIRVRDGRVLDVACAIVQLSDGTKVAIAQDITERKRAEERIRATTEQLRALPARLQAAKEEEDIRIAREIHDEMGSTLTSLRWELERLDRTISDSTNGLARQSLKANFDEMRKLTNATISTMRRIASELRPGILDDLGLMEAIEWQTEQFEARTGIECRCDCPLEDVEFNPQQATAIFRIFQEALTNVLRHSGAKNVEVTARRDKSEFFLTIHDDGNGIRNDQISGNSSLGILGMRERAHLIGGDLKITGIEKKGTLVTLRVPI